MGRYVRIDTGDIDTSSPIYQLYQYLECQYVSIRNIDTCGAVSPSLATGARAEDSSASPTRGLQLPKREINLEDIG